MPEAHKLIDSIIDRPSEEALPQDCPGCKILITETNTSIKGICPHMSDTLAMCSITGASTDCPLDGQEAEIDGKNLKTWISPC